MDGMTDILDKSLREQSKCLLVKPFLNVGINKTELEKFRNSNSDGTQCASGLQIH